MHTMPDSSQRIGTRQEPVLGRCVRHNGTLHGVHKPLLGATAHSVERRALQYYVCGRRAEGLCGNNYGTGTKCCAGLGITPC
eukprot:9408855-Lingulodinium_polyedra.AAC.1